MTIILDLTIMVLLVISIIQDNKIINRLGALEGSLKGDVQVV